MTSSWFNVAVTSQFGLQSEVFLMNRSVRHSQVSPPPPLYDQLFDCILSLLPGGRLHCRITQKRYRNCAHATGKRISFANFEQCLNTLHLAWNFRQLQHRAVYCKEKNLENFQNFFVLKVWMSLTNFDAEICFLYLFKKYMVNHFFYYRILIGVTLWHNDRKKKLKNDIEIFSNSAFSHFS
jgi:hypothetical protein